MSQESPFGIGCFHFRYQDQQPFKFSNDLYIAELQRVLQSLPNVSNVRLECRGHDDDEIEVEKEHEIPTIRERGGPFPGPSYNRLDFDLFIPKHHQEQLTRRAGVDQVHTSEKYHVTMIDAFHLTVTFVEPMDATLLETPSTAVIVVREFLDRELRNIPNCRIAFGSLGPSPFHAQCSLVGPSESLHDELEPNFDCNCTSAPYPLIDFGYNPAVFDDDDEAKSALFEFIAGELDLFYHVSQNRHAAISHWVQVRDQVAKVIHLHRRKGLRGALWRFWSAGRELNEAYIQLAEFEVDELAARADIERQYRDHYSGDGSTFFQSSIDREIAGLTSYPVQQMSHLLGMFESRRLKSAEILAVIVGAILGFFGGIGGAMFTTLFDR